MATKSKLFLIPSILFSVAAAGEHAAHVHGQAHLNIAAAGDALQIEFESPAANLVGFEHLPHEPEEKRALEMATQRLAGGDRLVRFNGANCRLEKAGVEAPHGDGERAGHGEHASFHASYRFRCDNLAQLNSVSVALFASFPDIHEIKVQWLTPGHQGAATLTAQHNELQLK